MLAVVTLGVIARDFDIMHHFPEEEEEEEEDDDGDEDNDGDEDEDDDRRDSFSSLGSSPSRLLTRSTATQFRSIASQCIERELSRPIQNGGLSMEYHCQLVRCYFRVMGCEVNQFSEYFLSTFEEVGELFFEWLY